MSAKYVWIKGDYHGTTEEYQEEKDGFTIFKSGRRINNDLLDEFMTIEGLASGKPLESIRTNTSQSTSQLDIHSGYKFDSGDDSSTSDMITDASGNTFNVKEINSVKTSYSNNNPEINRIKTLSQSTPKPQKSPVNLLIDKSIKEPYEISFNINMEIPSKDFFNVILNSFKDDFNIEDELISYLVSKIDIKTIEKDLKDKIKSEIINHYK